ncbi:MAG: hypothetical protein JO336_03640 [Acidobacteriia bacterium]|nr:hypothetical protein [Terriglobia bacterium]MBV9742302.1 hypothetical protein [Terriglobia bacterium]
MRAYLPACLLLLTAAALPVLAHHSFDAEYDENKTATMTGIVTNVEWINPHAFISISFKDESGATKEYKVELGPPYALTRGGWKRDTVKIGDKVTLQNTALAKDGSNRAGSTQNTFLVLANGQKLPMR